MSEYKLESIYKLNGKIKLLSGLHIGGNEAVIEIGGNDNPIIRDISTGDPYIPGSSLKGKIRYLLEWYTGNINSDGSVFSSLKEGENINILLNVFGGTAGGNGKNGPTRITVKDSFLSNEAQGKLKEIKERTGTDTELKTENSINRLNSSAVPRSLERVPRNLEFDFEIVYKVLNIDDKEKVKELILKGLKLLEIEGIGGSVSRGSGQIEIKELKVTNLYEGTDEKISLNNIKLGK
ncbi:type III-A CRISPR-associated RAMP protein Csm3 [Leptotrichia sp. OH3620_COT-345]|uniref:type III-A CRISPR-associated RAMP protein Csm3 n=1 Tax=Leptotrichia sp. OH3620_COT-345 TaxID=2491048 RepID=UPI000F64D121|nr:type III-A CRISPR-associated RAMP protein Csm3 [Leptotrichia sp. OH3620_COT-345]RRD40018.1 type III-A CRISPR-associated RAMP protein Csm3 [Leptotrichia sp. OH3620_COT-345]